MIISPTISQVFYYFYRRLCERSYFRVITCAFLVAVLGSASSTAGATIVRMETGFGNIDIELYDNEAPKTVANFLRYAGRGDYSNFNGFFHRSVRGFVLQAGGFTVIDFFGQPFYTHIPVDPPIQNEFSPLRSNVRGTIAMAKVGGNPDSATSEWFFNLADNSGAPPNGLDFQNGGFTVFGRILGSGMDVVDAIAGLPVLDARAATSQSALGELPVTNYTPAIGLKTSNLVKINRIPNVAAARTPLGSWAVFTADAGKTFSALSAVNSATAVTQLTSFLSPPNQSVHFNNGMFSLTITGVMGSPKPAITMYDAATTRPNRYYAYGKTSDDPSPHWYDFTFDGTTGAEIKSDRIILYFVDGERGDDDLTANNSITHTGAQAVLTPTTSTDAQSGGCSIAATSSRTIRGGDWIVVSLFLIFIALVRRHPRRQRF